MANVIRKRKRSGKSVVIDDSSSSNEETFPTKDRSSTPNCPPIQNTSRSSERLQEKRCRKFHMPTKEKVWENISPGKSPGKYEHLRPKRLVNNYTKENNRYNYDPNETSGDESMEDFLDDSISEMSSSSEEQESKSKKPKRQIKGRHHRLIVRLGSEDSDLVSDDAGDQETLVKQNEDILSGDSAICVKTVKVETKKRRERQLQAQGSICKSKIELNSESDSCEGTGGVSDEQSDEDDYVLAKTRKNNRSIIESDENDCNDEEVKVKKERDTDAIENNDSDSDEVVVKREHNRSIIESDEDSGSCKRIMINLKQENSENSLTEVIKEIKTEGVVNLEYISASDTDGNESSCDVDRTSKSSENTARQKTKVEPSPCTSEISEQKCNSEDGIDVCGKLAIETSETSDSESGSCQTSDSKDISDSDEADGSDTDETEGYSSQIRMFKKKQKRNELFEQFRKERERRLSKEHKVKEKVSEI